MLPAKVSVLLEGWTCYFQEAMREGGKGGDRKAMEMKETTDEYHGDTL